MKKGFILSVIVLGCAAMPSIAAPGFSSAGINTIQTLQGNGMHDLESFKQQRFRYEEINDAKDLKEQKEKKNREQAEISGDPAMKKIMQSKPPKDIQFVEQDGQIKIEDVGSQEQ